MVATPAEFHVEPTPGLPYAVYMRSRTLLPTILKEHGITAGRCFAVTDDNVAELYGAQFEATLQGAGFEVVTHIVPPGEAAKDLDALAAMYRWGFANDIDRESPVIALGGGVVGDLAGFFSATILRGVRLVHVPTTLVAQVDSSIGGKTGINHQSGKNLIGSFYRPLFTLTDTDFLGSLPEVEWRNGMAEVLKHALIRDPTFYEALREAWAGTLGRAAGVFERVVKPAMRIKIEIVGSDELEHGVRRILNFGHTFGHAIERIAGYGTIGHGAAVALGMRAATWLSAERGFDVSLVEVDALLRTLRPEILPRLPLDWLIQSMRRDKKRVGNVLHLILLEEVGRAVVVDDVTEDEIRAALQYALS